MSMSGLHITQEAWRVDVGRRVKLRSVYAIVSHIHDEAAYGGELRRMTGLRTGAYIPPKRGRYVIERYSSVPCSLSSAAKKAADVVLAPGPTAVGFWANEENNQRSLIWPLSTFSLKKQAQPRHLPR